MKISSIFLGLVIAMVIIPSAFSVETERHGKHKKHGVAKAVSPEQDEVARSYIKRNGNKKQSVSNQDNRGYRHLEKMKQLQQIQLLENIKDTNVEETPTEDDSDFTGMQGISLLQVGQTAEFGDFDEIPPPPPPPGQQYEEPGVNMDKEEAIRSALTDDCITECINRCQDCIDYRVSVGDSQPQKMCGCDPSAWGCAPSCG